MQKQSLKAPKKRILFIATLSEQGGTQKYIQTLSEEFGSDYDITIASSSKDDFLYSWTQDKNIKTTTIPSLDRTLWKGFLPTKNDFKAFLNLYNLLRKEKFDIVHLNSSKAGFLGALAAKITSTKKVVFTAHGWIFNEPEKIRNRNWLWVWLSRFAALFQDRIICVSQYDFYTAVKNKIAHNRKLISIANGLNRRKTLFASKSRAKKWLAEKIALPEDALVVGTIANFYKTKDLATLLNSLTQLPQNVILVTIGGSKEPENIEEKQRLENLVSNLGLDNRVFFLGPVEDGWKWIRAFDVYAISSVKEGLPFSALEAMAAGLPIVSTPVGGLKELLVPQNIKNESPRALIFPAGEPAKMAHAIDKLLNDSSLASELASNASQAVKDHFDHEQMLEKTRWVYEF